MDGRKHDILEQKLCKEIELIENKYANGNGEMAIQDVEKLDKLYHTLKSKATYDAMKEAEEYEDLGLSGRRGHDVFSEGYDRGYSEAMHRMHNDGNSGHYYPHMPYGPRY